MNRFQHMMFCVGVLCCALLLLLLIGNIGTKAGIDTMPVREKLGWEYPTPLPGRK